MNLTNEEKDAIEQLKHNASFCITGMETTSIILNLIKKQQKEIENKDKQIENLEMEHSLKLIGKEEEIKANMKEIIEEYYVPIEKYRKIEKEVERLKVVEKDYNWRMKASNKEILKRGYIPKEAIRELLNETYCGIPIYRLIHDYLPKNLKSLLGE